MKNRFSIILILFTLCTLFILNCDRESLFDLASENIKSGPITFSPTPGTYYTDIDVTLSTIYTDYEIRYTTDGSEPLIDSTLYTTPIPVTIATSPVNIRAGLVRDGEMWKQLDGTYTVTTPPVIADAPVLSPAPGTFEADQTIGITTTTPGATIYYTLDGSTPNAGSFEYTTAIPINLHGTNITINAIAIGPGMIDSTVTTGSYEINYLVNSDPNLYTFYPLDGDALDAVANNDGAITGTPIYAPDNNSNPNSAFQFDGTNYIRIPDTNTPLSGNFTISMWIQYSTAVYNMILSKHPNGTTDMNQSCLALYTTGTDVYFHMGSGAASFDISAGIAQNIWQHVTIRFDNGDMTLFVNGTPSATNTFIGTVQNLAVQAYIGFISNPADQYFDGTIDNVRIYNAALTDTQILGIYNVEN